MKYIVSVLFLLVGCTSRLELKEAYKQGFDKAEEECIERYKKSNEYIDRLENDLKKLGKAVQDCKSAKKPAKKGFESKPLKKLTREESCRQFPNLEGCPNAVKESVEDYK